MGYLYYGNYALLFEIGRVEAIRAMGTTYKYMEEEMGVMMPVISMECRYLAPAKYDELITIKTILKELPTKIIEFHHEIYDEEKKLIHRGNVKLFFIDMKTNKRVSTPSFLTDKIKHLF
jgi:acyl-CoA thioester hydrolase